MGLMTDALPAKAISPTCSPCSKSSKSLISALARSKRLGTVSSASIDLLTSRQIMIWAPIRGSTRCVAPHCGRMTAKTNAPSAASQSSKAKRRRQTDEA